MSVHGVTRRAAMTRPWAGTTLYVATGYAYGVERLWNGASLLTQPLAATVN